MHHILISEYGINVKEQTVLSDQKAYLDENYIYFIMSIKNNKSIHIEQAALAYYLSEHNDNNVAYPIRNRQGQWFTTHNDNQLMVLKANFQCKQQTMSYGLNLATFHQIGSLYTFEPQTISSYGQWKNLWITKLTALETEVERKVKEENDFNYLLIMDILPYIIGICENAIQYIAESETDLRFNKADQGSITFYRYNKQLDDPFIWFYDLTYDHPTRDIAEYIRYQYLLNHHGDIMEIVSFLNNYQQIRSLSIFSWQQLYGRLIYPAHFFDCIEEVLFNKGNGDTHELEKLVHSQTSYEEKLKDLFATIDMSRGALEIPKLAWL